MALSWHFTLEDLLDYNLLKDRDHVWNIFVLATASCIMSSKQKEMPKVPLWTNGKIWVRFSRPVTFNYIILRANPDDLGEESNFKWGCHVLTYLTALTCTAPELGFAQLPPAKGRNGLLPLPLKPSGNQELLATGHSSVWPHWLQ